MRKVILPLLMSLFIITGCSDEPNTVSLPGTWTGKATGCSDPAYDDTELFLEVSSYASGEYAITKFEGLHLVKTLNADQPTVCSEGKMMLPLTGISNAEDLSDAETLTIDMDCDNKEADKKTNTKHVFNLQPSRDSTPPNINGQVTYSSAGEAEVTCTFGMNKAF